MTLTRPTAARARVYQMGPMPASAVTSWRRQARAAAAPAQRQAELAAGDKRLRHALRNFALTSWSRQGGHLKGVDLNTLKVLDQIMVEKRKPTYDLETFKRAFSAVERLNVTGTAVRTAAALGFGRVEIVAMIQTMERGHFFKSMTSYGDYKIWQDVYHVPSPAGQLYVKFTADVVTEFVLLSFKAKEEDQ